MAISKKLRQKNNEDAAKFFAAGICGIIVLCMFFHWTRYVYKRYELSKSKALRLPVSVTRFSRYFLTRKIFGFPSMGHALVFLAYISINICITFTRIDWTNLVSISKRLGWVAMSNLCLVIFLSLKHTPLAFLTAYSYEHLQGLHQIAGYTAVACMFIHPIVYITCWDKLNSLEDLLEKDQIMGIVAGLSSILLFLTTLLKRRSYELFHVVHSVLAALIIIAAALHRPKLVTKSSYGLLFCGVIWGFDRLIRSAKLLYHGVGNKATLTPLPHGGTKVTLHKAPKHIKAGMHIWLHLPSIRKVELHPFTVTSTQPLELVIAAQDGFTRDLHKFAVENPGTEISASFDGAYGSVPDFRGLDKVVFIAGGSGGSFTAGVAVDLVRKLSETSNVMIEFIWVVRYFEMLSWYSTQLSELASNPNVNLRLHVTHHTSPSSTSNLESTSSSPLHDPEKPPISPSPISSLDNSKSTSNSHDLEKSPSPVTSGLTKQYTIINSRPDISSIIDGVVKSAGREERVGVVACGPGGMMRDVRKCVADNLRADGPAVEYWGEAFGW